MAVTVPNTANVRAPNFIETSHPGSDHSSMIQRNDENSAT
jgi:hypothetical protein